MYNKRFIKQNPVTVTFLVICIIYYICTIIRFGFSLSGFEASQVGAFNPVLFLYEQNFLSLVTSNFVHFSLLHIVMNMMALMNIGVILEYMIGSKKVKWIYIISILTTNIPALLIFILNQSNAFTFSGGFSGVLCGLLGALLILAYRRRNYNQRLYQDVLKNVGIIVIISIAIPNISLLGHLGGFIGGVLTIIFLTFKKQNEHKVHESVIH